VNIQQLRYLCAVVKADFSVTHAARALHTSQPGVSQQLHALEKELGVAIFARQRRRLVGLTPDGERIFARAESALLDFSFIHEYAQSVHRTADRHLVIATTATQARYTLPQALKRFSEQFPDVRLTLQHGNPAEIAGALVSGEAHLGVIPLAQPLGKDILLLEGQTYQRVLVVPDRHPLLRRGPLTLARIAHYPLITYEHSIGARQQVLQVFEDAGIPYRIILSALDADVIKRCVELGLGIAVLPDVALDASRDKGLRALQAAHLFPPSITGVALHRKHHLPRHALDFVEIFAPRWTRREVEQLTSR
jgi:LysR family cys regulon transcriptional activator